MLALCWHSTVQAITLWIRTRLLSNMLWLKLCIIVWKWVKYFGSFFRKSSFLSTYSNINKILLGLLQCAVTKIISSWHFYHSSAMLFRYLSVSLKGIILITSKHWQNILVKTTEIKTQTACTISFALISIL